MNDKYIIELVLKALNDLIQIDSFLIRNNLNEPCISHRLACHLMSYFQEFDIDCEYNLKTDPDIERKRIHYIEEHLGENINEAFVIPDIIIHKRGTNENNLCILELKKHRNRVGFQYDRVKLQAYTHDFYGNNLNYQIGFFVIVDTDNCTYSLEILKDGQHINFDS